MAGTELIASQHTIDSMSKLVDKYQRVPAQKTARNTVKVLDALLDVFWAMPDSPLFPWLCYTTVEYSLDHCVCPESMVAINLLGMLKISLGRDYQCGKMLARTGKAMLEKFGSTRKTRQAKIRALGTAYQFVDIWFTPLRDLVPKMKSCYYESLEIGEPTGMYLLTESFSFSLHGGENLSVLSQSSLQICQMSAQQSHFLAHSPIIECVLLMELTGRYEDYFSVLGSSFHSLDDIEAEAKSSSNDIVLYQLAVINLLRFYWRGDYVSAEQHSRKAWENKNCRTPDHRLQLLNFFSCLISFSLYRTMGDGRRLSEGEVMLERMEEWAQHSSSIFRNRWLLLKAEHATSVGIENHYAEQFYRESIKESKDRGYIHDLALGYELMGCFLAETSDRRTDSVECFKSAHRYYLQWGANKVAEKLQNEHDMDVSLTSSPNIEWLSIGSSKHSRQWE
ncbi:hypothetical protein ACHAWF_005578 [Thalassiosira exigua]